MGGLKLWSWAVILFGAVLCMGAVPATAGIVGALLEALSREAVTFSPALHFSLGVLGAVTIGWGLTFLAALRSPAPDWNGLMLAVGAWFVIDSILSILSGFGLNVVPNLVFFVWFAWLWSQARRAT